MLVVKRLKYLLTLNLWRDYVRKNTGGTKRSWEGTSRCHFEYLETFSFIDSLLVVRHMVDRSQEISRLEIGI